MKNAGRSFWESELYNRTYDLIVIGAGLTGQSAAYFYKKSNPEADVLVIDRGYFPIGASTRNAGFACFGSVTEHMADMKIESKQNIIDRIKRRFKGLQLLRETLGDENIGYSEPGSYEIFTDDQVYKSALEHIDFCNGLLKEAAGVDDVYQQTEVNGFQAISIKHEGCLHPGKMMLTLYKKNLSSGVEFRWNSKASVVDVSTPMVKLENRIELKSRNLIVATNSFTPDLLPGIDITPGRGYVFVTKPISGFKWPGTYHYDAGYYYFRGVEGNRLLLGGARSLDIDVETTTVFDVNEKIKDHLVQFANEVLKLPNGWEIDAEWSGIMGFTPTKSPVLEKISEHSVVVAGLSGMGVALGMKLGSEASELILTK